MKYVNISATVPSGHQGNVSNEKTNCQLPVADYQLPVADYQLLLRQPLVASPGEFADPSVLLRDHMGQYSDLLDRVA